MKNAGGVIELLIVIVVVIILYFTCFNNPSGRSDPFTHQKEVKTQQQAVNEKIKEIETKKELKNRIEQNLNRENY